MQEIKAKKIATGLMFGEGIRWTGSSLVLSDMLEKNDGASCARKYLVRTDSI